MGGLHFTTISKVNIVLPHTPYTLSDTKWGKVVFILLVMCDMICTRSKSQILSTPSYTISVPQSSTGIGLRYIYSTVIVPYLKPLI